VATKEFFAIVKEQVPYIPILKLELDNGELIFDRIEVRESCKSFF